MRAGLDILLFLSSRLGLIDVDLGPHRGISVKVWGLALISATHLPSLV